MPAAQSKESGMAGFEWHPPHEVEKMRAAIKTEEDQIEFDLMLHIYATGVYSGGMMQMPNGEKKWTIAATVGEPFIGRMRAVNPDNWIARMNP
jgi:hypothetical protein